jgi:PepSY-associated TM region
MATARPDRATRSWRIRTFRQWHRWIGFTAAFFLIFAATTGTIVAFTEFFGPEERLREATRKLTSPVTVDSPDEAWATPIGQALATVREQAASFPVDRITIEFKGENPRVQVFTGKPAGGEDRQFVVEARTGELRSVEAYADKPFLFRLHSGEAFGDGGLDVLGSGAGDAGHIRILHLPHDAPPRAGGPPSILLVTHRRIRRLAAPSARGDGTRSSAAQSRYLVAGVAV